MRHLSRAASPFGRQVRVAIVLAAAALALSATLAVQARQVGLPSASPKPGAWTVIGAEQGGATPAVAHVGNGNELVVWQVPLASTKTHYNAAELKPNGGLAGKSTDIFGGKPWGSLTGNPSLVSENRKPLLVFEGGRTDNPTDPYGKSCIVGDLLSGGAWRLQPWSLSAGCVNPDNLGAASTTKGVVASAWPGGWAGGNGVLYRIGTSPSIPAGTPDHHISTAIGDAGRVAATTETNSQNIYAGWTRFFSKKPSSDGIWVANLSTKSAPQKAPGTGTNTVASYPEPVAMASPTVHGGIYLAYCNDASPCTKVLLWRAGAKSAKPVPQSSNPRSLAISAGPSGRLWVAWWSSTNGTVRVVRTNEAANAFGPVQTYAGPHGCKGDGNATIRISGGPEQRLDVIVSCFDYLGSPVANHALATQSIVPLQIGATTATIKQKKGGSVTYRVSDVGDAVQGATVAVDGKKGTTDKKGQITFHFSKGAKTGTFKVVASKANYRNATMSLHVV